jgi:hypothetical protein
VTEIGKVFVIGWLRWFERSIEHIIDGLIEDLEKNYEDDTPERIANYIIERIEEELGKLERGIKYGNIQ